MVIIQLMKRRNIEGSIAEALDDTPVIYVNGPRQSGKSTLVSAIAEKRGHRYLTLDDAAVLAAATNDAQGFVARLRGPIVIDEVQRAPALLRAIKLAVDRDRRPGHYLLTGSADVLLLPEVSDSLAGRMEIHTLWPFSRGEIEGCRDALVDRLLAPRSLDVPSSTEDINATIDSLFAGGYPEVIARSARRRGAWFGSYVTTILQRDIRDLARIEGLTELPGLLALCAARAGGLLNASELSRSSQLRLTTLKRYLALLETTFLILRVPAWAGNLSKRLVRAPKLYMCDTGLLAHLTGATPAMLATDHTRLGPLLENYVAMEIAKQLTWSDAGARLYHYRTHAGSEVDLVLEDASGSLVGIEVKSCATVSHRDFRALSTLAEAVGPRWRRGVVLYLGSEPIPFGEGLDALPLSALWTG